MEKEYSVTIDGEVVTFQFKDSLIHAEGEHAGNIDAIITTKPPLPQNRLLDELHIKVPGTDEYLYIYGYGAVENSLKATFNSSTLVDIQKLPEVVNVYWGEHGEQFIGEMCCQPFTEEAESKIILDETEEEGEEQEVSEQNKVEEKKLIKADSFTKDNKLKYKKLVYALLLVLFLTASYFLVV